MRFMILFLFLAAQGWGATYYIDKRCANEGNGSAPTCAASVNGPGAFKGFTRSTEPTFVPAGADHDIYIVAGSGPYHPTDAMRLGTGYIYPGQNNPANTVTYHFNGEWAQWDWNVNTPAYTWVQSTAVGKTTWYYLLAADLSKPQRPASHLGGDFPTISTVVIGDHLTGDWNDTATNLINTASYKPNNWAWGDFDTLGYSTLYVHLEDDADPSASGVGIWVSGGSYIVRLSAGFVKSAFTGGTFTGTGASFYAGAPVHLSGCTLANNAEYGIQIIGAGATGSTVQYSRFINAGHRGVSVGAAADVTVYNSYFDRVHLAVLFYVDGVYTVTFKNNLVTNAYAGAIQKDFAAPVLVEDHNLFHLDPLSTHGGHAIAFTGGVANWTTTDLTDIPAGATTTDVCTPACGVDPHVTATGSLISGSPAINSGVDVGLTTDIEGKAIRGLPDIGAYEFTPGGNKAIIQRLLFKRPIR